MRAVSDEMVLTLSVAGTADDVSEDQCVAQGGPPYVRFSNRPSGSSTFRLSTTPVSMSLTGSRFSSDSAPRPFHHGDFEDEVEQSFGRPCRQYDSRSKRTNDLTSSIVPRGTSFHRWVDLRFFSYLV